MADRCAGGEIGNLRGAERTTEQGDIVEPAVEHAVDHIARSMAADGDGRVLFQGPRHIRCAAHQLAVEIQADRAHIVGSAFEADHGVMPLVHIDQRTGSDGDVGSVRCIVMPEFQLVGAGRAVELQLVAIAAEAIAIPEVEDEIVIIVGRAFEPGAEAPARVVHVQVGFIHLARQAHAAAGRGVRPQGLVADAGQARRNRGVSRGRTHAEKGDRGIAGIARCIVHHRARSGIALFEIVEKYQPWIGSEVGDGEVEARSARELGSRREACCAAVGQQFHRAVARIGDGEQQVGG